MKSLQEQIRKIFSSPGVYLLKDQGRHVLYVGKSTNVRDRLKSHLVSEGEKVRSMVGQARSVDAIPVASELEALLLEAELIKKHLPRYNSSAKDDKHPLYIKITTSEEYPKVLTSRREEHLKDLYFGPFPASRTVRSVLKQIRHVFPFCQQTRIGKRGCLYSHIGLCNPCPSEIEKIKNTNSAKNGQNAKFKIKKEYAKNIKNIISLLSGKQRRLKVQMVSEMDRAAKAQDFEKAAQIRDRLKQLEYITGPYKSPKEYLENPNLLEDIRQNELDNLYSLLAPRIKYLHRLKRIECFDVSHLGGKSATGSMVTFIDGEPEKNLYRRFKIYGKATRDDLAMMRETIKRRLKHLEDWGIPNLIIVDGGKGQVSAAQDVLSEAQVRIPLIGLAKRLEEIIISKEHGFTILRLAHDNPALHVLQRIRDEAHRFARKYHFYLRLSALKT